MSFAKFARSPLVWVLVIALAMRLGQGCGGSRDFPPVRDSPFPIAELLVARRHDRSRRAL